MSTVATETERYLFEVDRRLAVIEGRFNGGESFTRQGVCDERHRAQEERMSVISKQVTSVDVRLWAIVILALGTLITVLLK